jgi:hypothetical protein
MATVRTALRAGSRLPDPADAVRLAAEAMTDVEESHTFVTLLHARLDESTGQIRMIDAGHGFVFVLKASGELVQFPRHDLPLGVFPQQEYRETRVTLGPGDIFLTFSDGVLDLHPDVEQNFEDLTRLLAGAADAGEVIERLSTTPDAEGPVAGDDVTVVALRRSGDAQTSGISLTQRKKQRGAAVESPPPLRGRSGGGSQSETSQPC